MGAGLVWHNYLLSVLYMTELSSQRNGLLARKTDPVASAHFLLASATDVGCVNTPLCSGPCQMVMRHIAIEIIQLSPRVMRPDCLSSLLCSQIQTYACKRQDKCAVGRKLGHLLVFVRPGEAQAHNPDPTTVQF